MSDELCYKFDFETIDISDPETSEKNPDLDNEEVFAFRLFSGPSEANSIKKVSLKEEIEEEYQPKRPESYYVADTCEEYKNQINIAAVEFDSLFQDLRLPPIDAWPGKLMSLEELLEKSGKTKQNNRKGLNLRKQLIDTRAKLAKAERSFKLRRSKFTFRRECIKHSGK